MSLQKNLGITLKALRAEKGVSQEKLALSTGIDRRYMSDIEYSGKNKPAFRNGGNRQTGIQETALAA